jgi:hypothetical protein
VQSPSSCSHFARLAVVVDAGILETRIARGKDAAGLPLTKRGSSSLTACGPDQPFVNGRFRAGYLAAKAPFR